MNRLVTALLTGVLCCSGLMVSANQPATNDDNKKEVKSVRIYKADNPNVTLVNNDKSENLSVLYTRGEKMFQYLIIADGSIKQELDYTSARFLVNINNSLTFVDGKLYGDSVLVYRQAGKEERIDIKTVNAMGEGTYNPALFSFRLTGDGDEGFLIESWATRIGGSEGEWVKIKDGVPVVVKTTYSAALAGEADVFYSEMNRSVTTKSFDTTGQETAENPVSIVGDYGFVTVTGAQGKQIVVRNSAGQVIANRTAASGSVKINAPSGVALVSVDGQPVVKTLVK